MADLSKIDLKSLSEQELQNLINQSKKQIKKLKTKKQDTLTSKDADVVAVADAVRQLAKTKKVTPAVALSAVAKNMRVAMTPQRKARAAADVKYRHPHDPSKTWKGFGKRPLWLVEELNRGKRLEDFSVA